MATKFIDTAEGRKMIISPTPQSTVDSSRNYNPVQAVYAQRGLHLTPLEFSVVVGGLSTAVLLLLFLALPERLSFNLRNLAIVLIVGLIITMIAFAKRVGWADRLIDMFEEAVPEVGDLNRNGRWGLTERGVVVGRDRTKSITMAEWCDYMLEACFALGSTAMDGVIDKVKELAGNETFSRNMYIHIRNKLITSGIARWKGIRANNGWVLRDKTLLEAQSKAHKYIMWAEIVS